MQIEILPGDFIISPTFDLFGELQSDFVIKAIRFTNDAESPAELTALNFELLADGRVSKEIRYAGEALCAKLADGCERIRGAGHWGRKSMLGSSIDWNPANTADSTKLSPGQQAALVNEFFIVMSRPAVDAVRLRLRCLQDGTETERQLSVPVVNYQTKNKYTFPARGGAWQINGNYDCLGAHRTQYSMEFAIDLGRLNHDGLTVWKENMADEDYPAYGEDVLAIGDGRVTDCFRDAWWRVNFPNDTASDEEKAERAEIEKKVGRLPIQCGNYVVLEHAHGEYSFYGHMIRDSLTVQTGDTVKQGDVLGRIGNVGFSGSPHLHFHLMDGPDFYSARGLPCRFMNIRDHFMNDVSLIQEEYTIIHTT